MNTDSANWWRLENPRGGRSLRVGRDRRRAFSLLEVILALAILGGAVAVVCTVVEAVTPWGIDNLTVPAAAVLILDLLRN